MELTDAAADEAFLLDLLNSTPIIDGIQRDTLDRSWLGARGHSGSTAEWQTVCTARSALQAVVREVQPVGSITPLLEEVSFRPAISATGIQWHLNAPADRAAAVRAVLAWDAVLRTRPRRLRPCANPECTLFLIDHSKPNKARWCAMAVCGNRMKARRHYERTRTNPA
jgi:hypothetical protein